MATVEIETSVALQEEHALTEHYRNRNLVLAQAVADLKRENAKLKSQVTPPEPQTEEDQS
ncbi:MAG TPA: hypothetical protein VL202_12960 [Pararhizobium sp.]|uniref:hypothetical protein n=1 Tax=Pararhizobium sp. TaxID=1977563 RepID=UPI002CED6CB1|nr:hypothetical protein [Pararhizobium sp.]HTO32072.1 hypothetical protein [Pararhizobium sp.]